METALCEKGCFFCAIKEHGGERQGHIQHLGKDAPVLSHHRPLQDSSTSVEVLRYFCGRITVLPKKY